MTTTDGRRLPGIVRRYLQRSLAAEASGPPTIVRVRQRGTMWNKPGSRPMPFEATEEFAVSRTSFHWEARFKILGPLALKVTDRFDGGVGELSVSILGLTLQRQSGPELNVGEAMRYLAELPWAPQAIRANTRLQWQAFDERTVDVSYDGPAEAVVRWEFDDAGDPIRVTGLRPYRSGKMFVLTQWGADFSEYERFGDTRVPAAGTAWWDLPDGRFVYWSGRVTDLEVIG